MYPSTQDNLPGLALQVEPKGSPPSLLTPARRLRYSWEVKDCLISSWYELPSPLSIDEMWRLLVGGRYREARRLE